MRESANMRAAILARRDLAIARLLADQTLRQGAEVQI